MVYFTCKDHSYTLDIFTAAPPILIFLFKRFFLVFLMTLEIQEPVSPNIKYLGFMTTNFGKSICKCLLLAHIDIIIAWWADIFFFRTVYLWYDSFFFDQVCAEHSRSDANTLSSHIDRLAMTTLSDSVISVIGTSFVSHIQLSPLSFTNNSVLI